MGWTDKGKTEWEILMKIQDHILMRRTIIDQEITIFKSSSLESSLERCDLELAVLDDQIKEKKGVN